MIKTLSRLVGVLLLLTLTVNGIAQSKPAPKSKPAFKKPKPIANEEVKEETPAPQVDESIRGVPELPPLPEIDTLQPPNDELTITIKKLLEITEGINTSKKVMRSTLEMQQKMNSANLPDEFFARMFGAIENGQISGYFEIMMIKIYRKKFTVEEIREVIKFYETPIGKKMVAESGYITELSQSEGAKIGQYVAIKIIEGLMKEGKWK